MKKVYGVSVVVLCLLLFTWCGCSGGQKPAGVEIIAPDEDESVFGAVFVTVRTRDLDAGSVSLYLDEVKADRLLGECEPDLGGVCGVTWFSSDFSNGAHSIIAEAAAEEDKTQASLAVQVRNLSREESIPRNAVKMKPEDDSHPPILEPAFASVFEPCVPMAGPVNTAGAEDSPYITPDGKELYVFFTPDLSKPANEQLVDGVTGIYRSLRDGPSWTSPRRVFLNYYDDPSLDGCETIYGDEIWFCSVRAGNERTLDIYIAKRDGDHWVEWKSAGHRLNIELEVGELHLSDGGDAIYYHSQRSGGKGDIDIWVSQKDGDLWQDAVNLETINTSSNDGWPWVSEDGQEMWFTHGAGAPEIWRSVKSAGQWQTPEKVVGPFAGEPTFDMDGNLYFTHHFWDDDTNSAIEADIYFCKHK